MSKMTRRKFLGLSALALLLAATDLGLDVDGLEDKLVPQAPQPLPPTTGYAAGLRLGHEPRYSASHPFFATGAKDESVFFLGEIQEMSLCYYPRPVSKPWVPGEPVFVWDERTIEIELRCDGGQYGPFGLGPASGQ